MARVQSRAFGAPPSATPTGAFTSNVAAGSTLVVAGTFGAATSLSAPTDTLLNTYALVESIDDTTSNEKAALWVAPSPSGGANTVTLHMGAAPGDGGWCIAEFSGRHATVPIGNHTQATQATPGTAADGVSCGPITAVAGDDIVLFAADVGAIRTNTFTAGTSYIELVEGGAGGADIDVALFSRDNIGAGATTATATQANNDRTLSMVVALVAAGGGGGGGAVISPYFFLRRTRAGLD